MFEDWLSELESEVRELVSAQGPMSEQALAQKLRLSHRGAKLLLSKLEREMK
jgi:predicted ArsR family transcriptional regulator